MGILNDARAAINRGTATAERTARKLKLQTQINDINRRRQGLAAQLGASLYEATRNDENLRNGRESLYDGMAACDEERANLLAQIAHIDKEAAAEQSAARSFTCGVCGARVGETDMFCSGCGTPAAQAQVAAQPIQVNSTSTIDSPTCPSCGTAVTAGDIFCISCGTKLVQEA